MQIRLDQISDQPYVWDETEEIPTAALEHGELLALGPVRWRGRVTRAEPGYHLRARYSYQQTLRCDRCLGAMAQPVSGELELLILVHQAPPADPEVELSASDLGVLALPDDLLETDPLLYEQLHLNLPMKPLCRPDCKGLCPRCGADRNRESCGCVEREMDPRWAALAALVPSEEPSD